MLSEQFCRIGVAVEICFFCLECMYAFFSEACSSRPTCLLRLPHNVFYNMCFFLASLSAAKVGVSTIHTVYILFSRVFFFCPTRGVSCVSWWLLAAFLPFFVTFFCQFAEALTIISKVDFPARWPNLIEDLVRLMKTSGQARQRERARGRERQRVKDAACMLLCSKYCLPCSAALGCAP